MSCLTYSTSANEGDQLRKVDQTDSQDGEIRLRIELGRLLIVDLGSVCPPRLDDILSLHVRVVLHDGHLCLEKNVMMLEERHEDRREDYMRRVARPKSPIHPGRRSPLRAPFASELPENRMARTDAPLQTGQRYGRMKPLYANMFPTRGSCSRPRRPIDTAESPWKSEMETPCLLLAWRFQGLCRGGDLVFLAGTASQGAPVATRGGGAWRGRRGRALPCRSTPYGVQLHSQCLSMDTFRSPYSSCCGHVICGGFLAFWLSACLSLMPLRGSPVPVFAYHAILCNVMHRSASLISHVRIVLRPTCSLL